MKDQARTAIDRYRRSISVPRQLMPTVLAVHTGDKFVPTNEADELEASGILHAGRLDPLAATLVDVMINPTLVLTIDIVAEPKATMATIWARPRHAVLGTTDSRRRFHLVQIEPNLLPFHLAQLTNLTPGTQPAVTGGCSIPAAALTIAEDLANTDPATARQTLTNSGVSSEWSDHVIKVLAHRRSLWTVDSAWLGPHRSRAESRLCLLDAGVAGYWRLVNDGYRITITATDFDETMKRFAALLPNHQLP